MFRRLEGWNKCPNDIKTLTIGKERANMNIIKTTIAIALCAMMTGCITSFDGTIVPASSSTLQNEMTEGVYTA